MKTSQHEIEYIKMEQLCSLYTWLNDYVTLMEQNGKTQKDYQKLEDLKFPNTTNDLARIQQQLDLYTSMYQIWVRNNPTTNNSSPLSKKIQNELKFKNRPLLNISEAKADVCELVLRAGIPNSISFLYTAYPEVRNRLFNELLHISKETKDPIISNMITNTLNTNKDEKKAKTLK